MGGGGDAWSKDHKAILDHARNLHYDHVPGVSLPSADADRATWTSAMDRFNDWKAREVGKESSGQAWWQTYSGGDGGGGGRPSSGGKGPPDWDNPDPGTGTGPYPESNIYFPMLVPEYSDPKAQDWSQYMPQGQSGLLYQPWSQEYGEQFVPENIWNYNPPELKVGRPEFYQSPLGNIEPIYPEPEPEPESYDRANDPDAQYDGNPGYDGYDTDRDGMSPGMKDMIDAYNKANPMPTLSSERLNKIMSLVTRGLLPGVNIIDMISKVAAGGPDDTGDLLGGGQQSNNPADTGYGYG